MYLFYDIIGVIIGFLIIKYAFQITQTFGRVDLAERYLGTGLGGTYTMYKLLGLILITLCLLHMFGLFGFITQPLGPLFGAPK